jgi:hypothetical protein
VHTKSCIADGEGGLGLDTARESSFYQKHELDEERKEVEQAKPT